MEAKRFSRSVALGYRGLQGLCKGLGTQGKGTLTYRNKFILEP